MLTLRLYYSIFLMALLPVFQTGLLQAQNLVPNPGFETQISCPAVSEIQKAPPWNSPDLGTPDLFSTTCPSQNDAARTGIGSAGIFCYENFPNSREYIQARLTQPLTGGQTYCVSFYVKRSPFLYSVSTIGAYFSADSVYLVQTDPLPYTPNVVSPSGTQITSTSTWTEISGSFVASGGESFIIIGNFNNDANTIKQAASSSPDSVSYYQIDDISVTVCGSSGINDIALSNLTTVYPNPATGAFYIELPAGTGEVRSALLYDALSNRMNVQPEYENGKLLMRFDASQLPAGTYFAVITTDGASVVKKVCVVK